MDEVEGRRCPDVGRAEEVVDSLEDHSIEGIVQVLEQRGRNATYARWTDEYLDAYAIDEASSVLEIGCGTGVLCRQIARRPAFTGSIVGVDLSSALIEAGQDLARKEGVHHQIELRGGDAGDLPFDAQSFDRVIAHTIISHVTDPEQVLREMARVVTATGSVALFDGDYASRCFDHPDEGFAKQMEEALQASIVANPRIMRSLRRLLAKHGLRPTREFEWLYLDSPDGAFFGPNISVYGALMEQSGDATAEDVQTWVEYLESAREQNQFFAACNYYAVLATRV